MNHTEPCNFATVTENGARPWAAILFLLAVVAHAETHATGSARSEAAA